MSCGSALQMSKVHLKGPPPVKMTTENLHCCSSPWASKGTPDETITRKLLPLKPLLLSGSTSLPNLVLYTTPHLNPLPAPPDSVGTVPTESQLMILTGAWLCDSRIWRLSHPPFPLPLEASLQPSPTLQVPWALHPHTSLCWDCFAACWEETSCGSLEPDWS